ncbi:MAG TPA: helix-turn-helix domain-containing protein [Rhizomicrobium sp.]|nr:helix-turn-helix domain-containing protein [Rhizomicrobium sp.]
MKTQISSSHRANLGERAILAEAHSRKPAAPQPPMGAVHPFTQDHEIFAEGASADYFYKVVAGVVRTCKFLADGRRQIDAFHIPGDVFGLEAAAEYRLSAEAVTDCTVIAFRKGKLNTLAVHDGNLSQELLNFAMHSLIRAQEHSLLLGRRSAVEKVAGFLLDWAEKSASHSTLSLAMTRQDIADYLGLTIETVSRTLSQLERDAVIELPSARQIRVRNLETLEDLAA